MSLYFIELLQNDKISLVIAALFLADDMTGNQINKSNINIIFNYNEMNIIIIKKNIENKIKFILKNKTLDYLFRKFDSSKYLEVGKIFSG